MNKTIYIDPELLKINFSGTRKKKVPNKELKIQPSPCQKDNNLTLAKRKNILKFIRRHQDINVDQKNNQQLTLKVENEFDESMKFLMDMTDKIDVTDKSLPNINNDDIVKPKYGCLKHGGILPTYKQYQTQRNYITTNQNQPSLGKTPESNTNKKILKRTFRIGKSLKDQKVSVLVSNKTIRKEIANNDIVLKQTSMLDVRRYLVKHGLIKIGTSSPPDVLRQMYESASLMCGNVINHNSETLMYNFLNSDEKN